ncbi:MAG: hypothetical protein IJE05_03365 [Clostridia bacterium]|nr:hypothetical protein [Clostridia bacterium]
MNRKDKQLEEELKELRDNIKETKEDNNEVLQFFLGIIMLGAGLFMLSKRVMVHSSWHIWRIGSFDISSGLVTVPLIIGIIWQFYNSKSVIPKIIMTLGVVFIIITIIMSIRISFVPTSMFDYIIIMGLAAAGSGLLLKTVFKKRDK